jgi:hypothetical protein
MKLPPWTTQALIAIGILALGYGFGRFTTPSKLVETERLVSVDRDTELTWHAYVGHTESKVETKVAWKTITEWKQGGTVVQTVVANQDRTENNHTDVAENDGKVKEKLVYRDIEKVKIVESARPDWLISGQVGSRLDGWKPVYGGAVARRIIGPVFVGAWGQAGGLERSGAAAGIGVTLLF